MNEDFLSLMNRLDYPDFKAGVYLVEGRHGERYITTRPIEAWQLWAETNNYRQYDWFEFAEDFKDQIEWSKNGQRGFIDEGGSMTYMEVIGYERNGKDKL